MSTLELIPLRMIRNSIIEGVGPNLSQFFNFHFDLLQDNQESTFLLPKIHAISVLSFSLINTPYSPNITPKCGIHD